MSELIHRITERDELWRRSGTVVCAAAAGSYNVIVDGVFPPGIVKAHWIMPDAESVAHQNYAFSRGGLRLAGADVNMGGVQRADGFRAYMYLISNVATNIRVWCYIVFSR